MVSGDKPATCVPGDHQWPPPPSAVWVTGDGVKHLYVDGQGWVHDESADPDEPLDVMLVLGDPLAGSPQDPADVYGSPAWYERLAVDAFNTAKGDADRLHELAKRTPVWEEMCAKFAGVTARFAEAAAAAALASAFRRVEAPPVT